MISQAEPRRMNLAIAAAPVEFTIDGHRLAARQGETVLTALRLAYAGGVVLSWSTPRVGFCLMGACQDCWLWRRDGSRLRACTSRLEVGMSLVTSAPEAF
jgi:predicted molibdopterin-dependent oxidoreductase YjgC